MGTLSLSAASITYLTVSIFKVLIAATPNLFSVAYVKISFTFASDINLLRYETVPVPPSK